MIIAHHEQGGQLSCALGILTALIMVHLNKPGCKSWLSASFDQRWSWSVETGCAIWVDMGVIYWDSCSLNFHLIMLIVGRCLCNSLLVAVQMKNHHSFTSNQFWIAIGHWPVLESSLESSKWITMFDQFSINQWSCGINHQWFKFMIITINQLDYAITIGD